MRKLKVSSQYQERRWDGVVVPFIRLSGKWLEKAGFPIGTKITVRKQKGALVLAAS
ncbi:MAG TPA: SymE family type I addiction module toxin [Chthoniobacterales bacterium]|jgi:toxic protein SymE|nr:SymE family type I addiction module toxin [Chthoniobacterales bacterium]